MAAQPNPILDPMIEDNIMPEGFRESHPTDWASANTPKAEYQASARDDAAEPKLNWLFVDLNSYFASVEQDARPDLRGRPVAVVPMMADTTVCIAASYEAKAFGVRTGTLVADAKRMCPGIELVEARHELYVDYH